MKPKYDMLWKSMIEDLMADLLVFVDPDIGEVVDLARGFEYLDKELIELFPDPDVMTMKVVDKLVKVFLRDGTERWILLHIEIQGNNSKEFPKRMFEYFMRLRKRDRLVAAIAVLTGKKGSDRPGVHEDRCLWTCVRYEYKNLHIADYPDEVLAASNNPFATLMLIAKGMLLKATGTEDERDNILYEQKLMIDKLLNEKAAIFGDLKIRALKYFLYHYVSFKNRETNRKFIEESSKQSDKNITTMGIVEQIHEITRQEGVKEGLKMGKEIGLAKAVRVFLSNTEFSAEKIAELVGVPLSFVENIKKELSGK